MVCWVASKLVSRTIRLKWKCLSRVFPLPDFIYWCDVPGQICLKGISVVVAYAMSILVLKRSLFSLLICLLCYTLIVVFLLGLEISSRKFIEFHDFLWFECSAKSNERHLQGIQCFFSSASWQSTSSRRTSLDYLMPRFWRISLLPCLVSIAP